MEMEPQLRRKAWREGMRDGVPIALGYFAVAFSLGIAGRNAGLTPGQGFVISILNHASAGEYAGITAIAAMAPYWELALTILITNARYLLMSCALSQKFAPETSLWHRIGVGFGITDEIFGVHPQLGRGYGPGDRCREHFAPAGGLRPQRGSVWNVSCHHHPACPKG